MHNHLAKLSVVMNTVNTFKDILPQNALKRNYNGKCIEWIEGHYLEVVVLFIHDILAQRNR